MGGLLCLSVTYMRVIVLVVACKRPK